MRIVRIIMPVLFGLMLTVWIISNVMTAKKSDRISPVIASETDLLELSVKDPEAKLMEGLTAQDNKDGDLTDEIMIGSRSKFVSYGVFEVTYLVFDSGNNVGRYKRKIHYTDYHSPVIRKKAPLVFKQGSRLTILERLQADDCIEGDISDRIRIMSSDVNISKEGTYQVGVEVSNSFGDTVKEELEIQIEKEKVSADE